MQLGTDSSLLANTQPLGIGTTQSAPTSVGPTTTTTSSLNTASTSFSIKSTEFVPKGKMVKTVESFPTLDMGISKEPVKKKATAGV